MDVAVELSRIVITETSPQQTIILKEKEGERSFPIVIGINEALAIDRRLKGVEMPRPMTHDLLASVIGAMGGRLERIVINDLRDHTFIATLHIRRGAEVLEIDSGPKIGEAKAFLEEKIVEGALQPGDKAGARELLVREYSVGSA